jgi:DNA-binding transcriptional ArsR family regulator
VCRATALHEHDVSVSGRVPRPDADDLVGAVDRDVHAVDRVQVHERDAHLASDLPGRERRRDAHDVEARIESIEGHAASIPDDPDGDLTALGTLSDETRHTIARLLTAADGELCVCEISPVVDVSESAISHALSDLREAGLVTRRKDGTWRYYEATERAEAILAALNETRGEA